MPRDCVFKTTHWSNDYRSLGRLGLGAFGEVLRAEYRHATEPVVAIKCFNQPGASESANIGVPPTSLTEMMFLTELDHPAVCPAKAIYLHNGTITIVMPCLMTYNNMLAKNPSMRERLHLLRGFLSGLAYLHASSIIHQDLKCENLLVAPGTLVITDLGQTRFVSDVVMHTTTVGTPGFRAPELVLKAAAVTQATDVFSAAVIIFRLITGEDVLGVRDSEQKTEIHALLRLLGPPQGPLDADSPSLRMLNTSAANMKEKPTISQFKAKLAKALENVGIADNGLAELVGRALSWSPADRPTAQELLNHPNFALGAPDVMKSDPREEEVVEVQQDIVIDLELPPVH